MSLEDFLGGGWGKAGNTAKLSPAGAGAWLSLAKKPLLSHLAVLSYF